MHSMIKYLSLIFIASLFPLYGCVGNIDIDLAESQQPVVNCILTRDSIQRLTLTYSSSLNSNFYDEIEDAKIFLYDSGKLVGEFHKTSYAGWELKYRPWMGHSYELRVEIPDRETITAKTTFPNRLPIYRVKDRAFPGQRYFQKDSTNVFWTFAFEKPEDMYMHPVVIEKRFKLYPNIGSDLPSIDDFNAKMLDGSDGTQKKYNTYMRCLPDNKSRIFYLEQIYSSVVVFRAVSHEYDQYLKSSIAKLWVYNAFDDPTQWLDESEVYTNINNGLGIFGAYHDLMFNCNESMPD